MDLNNLKYVMNKYGKAWENRDTNLLLSIFTLSGIYQESPLSKPYKGHKEIKKFWDKTVVIDQRDIHFKTKSLYISSNKKIGFAEWECNTRYKGNRHRMVGIMLIKMKNKKISYLNEYWNTIELK